MHWNPFQYQLTANYLSTEGDEAVLELKRGTVSETVRLPTNLLPPGLELGSNFSLKFEDSETSRTNQTQALKYLLNELIQ